MTEDTRMILKELSKVNERLNRMDEFRFDGFRFAEGSAAVPQCSGVQERQYVHGHQCTEIGRAHV